jgi:hypothetical protein
MRSCIEINKIFLFKSCITCFCGSFEILANKYNLQEEEIKILRKQLSNLKDEFTRVLKSDSQVANFQL